MFHCFTSLQPGQPRAVCTGFGSPLGQRPQNGEMPPPPPPESWRI